MSLSTKADCQNLLAISMRGKDGINEILHFTSDQDDGITVEVALQWTDTYNEKVLYFTNNIPQRDGGTHLSGFRSAFDPRPKQLYGS